MSWGNPAPSGGDAWNSGGNDNWKGEPGVDTFNDFRAGGFNDESAQQGGGDFGGGQDGGVGGDGACRNCGQEGHFARECAEPRKFGACFNCGEEGHSKADCDKPRVFKGECRTCNKEGHPASECPDRVLQCRQCNQEGHEAINCKNPMTINMSKVPDKTEGEAWALLNKASDERDIHDFKEAVQILVKSAPEMTYTRLEKEFRKRAYNIFLIAMEKDHGDTLTNVNLQGEVEKKYTVAYFLSEKAQRPNMKERWPKTPEENLERLANAGVPMDRGIPKCGNCEKLGHMARACTEDKRDSERPVIKCALCDQEGHRVRDCTQERKKLGAPRACRICESEEHMAKDCPDRVVRTCRNCDSEDHMAKECTEPRNPANIQCRNCDEMGHTSKDCTAPKDWSRVTCKRCGEKGHGERRCKMPAPEEDAVFSGNENTSSGRFNTTDAPAASGGWNDGGKAGVSSAHNEWENATPAPVAATATVSGGW